VETGAIFIYFGKKHNPARPFFSHKVDGGRKFFPSSSIIFSEKAQIGVIGATAAAQNFYAVIMVEAEHGLAPVLQIVAVENLGSVEFTVIQR